MIAALFVERGGIYYGLPDVDPWDKERDARTYAGPWPVVAHPPCARWCRLAGLVEKRWGYRKGDDGGTFEAALRAVRSFGGVLEHPAYSDAWPAFGLTPPNYGGGWQASIDGGWVCYVEQGRHGHAARKATWLYAYSVPPRALADFDFGSVRDREAFALVSFCGNRVASGEKRPRLRTWEASATPIAFRDHLLNMARAVRAA